MITPNPRIPDSLDARIILALDEDPEASALALSRTLSLARNAVHARLTKLERGGALVNELAVARMPVRNVWLVTSSYWKEFGSE
ncbi:DNA-binding Lrp family transcriptional regulator [Arthrobacter sp. V4I6]|nr:DNA-binding Lrp family transcriptional regulator [Arthrobacter sp. V1I7]MDQ0853342.1 DNA-binding Lrp family transcriptional regulator [Arthrobacter sp. V4I6]